MRVVEFYEEARLEIEEAVAWYDTQEVPGLGDRLVRELRTALDKVRTLPKSFPVVEGAATAVYYSVDSHSVSTAEKKTTNSSSWLSSTRSGTRFSD